MRLSASAGPRALAAGALIAGLASCTSGGTNHPAPPSAKPSASAAKTYSPLDGPVESAAQLPKSCSAILTEAELTTAFGATQSGDNAYGNYAPLPGIGRTGRVTCGFGRVMDASGGATPPSVTVSIITYDTAKTALDRINKTQAGSVAKGATVRATLVNGHPATILVEPAAASTPAQAAPSTSPSASPGAASASASAASPGTPAGGDTELLLADGNRTFVVLIPLSKAAGPAADQLLTAITSFVYQHTLPAAAPSPAPPGSAAASPAASPGPTRS
jgi:hypothetical protein